MKSDRQNMILRIINEKPISTQEELTSILNNAGFNTTQATVSRDIRELKLVKIHDEKNVMRYAATNDEAENIPLLRRSVVSVDSAGNIAVLKCKSGMASAVCAEIDSMHYPNVVGTIAGDDTIFILFRNYKQAEEFSKNYNGE